MDDAGADCHRLVHVCNKSSEAEALTKAGKLHLVFVEFKPTGRASARPIDVGGAVMQTTAQVVDILQ